MSERPWPSLSVHPYHASVHEKPSDRSHESTAVTALQVPSRLSMSQMTTCRWSFLDDVHRYSEAGIRTLAVWRPKLVDFGEERSIELLQEYGLQVSSLNWAGGFTGANGYSFNEAVHDVREAVRTASRLGTKVLTIVSGARLGHIQPHASRLLLEGLRATVDYAAEFGVTLALQPMHRVFQDEWTFVHTLEQTIDVLEQIDHPFLQIAFGTYHLWQESGLLSRLPVVADKIAVVQISDWGGTPRCDNDRLPPGAGVIPLAAILCTLDECGYGGYYEVDVWSTELWKSDDEHLLRQACGNTAQLLRAPKARLEDRGRNVRS